MGTTINSQGGPHPPGEIAIPGDGHPDPSLTQPYTILPVGLCLPGCKAPPLSALPSCPDFWQRCRVPRGSLWQPQFLRWEVDSGEGVTSLGAFSLVLVRVFSTWLHGSDSGGTFWTGFGITLSVSGFSVDREEAEEDSRDPLHGTRHVLLRQPREACPAPQGRQWSAHRLNSYNLHPRLQAAGLLSLFIQVSFLPGRIPLFS